MSQKVMSRVDDQKEFFLGVREPTKENTTSKTSLLLECRSLRNIFPGQHLHFLPGIKEFVMSQLEESEQARQSMLMCGRVHAV
jgi:hypothetical protein